MSTFQSRLCVVALLAGVLAGCTASIPQSYVLNDEPPARDANQALSVLDARAPADKLMQVEQDANYLVVRYGDGDFSVDRMQLFTRRLEKEIGSSAVPIKIEVSRFSSVVTRQSVGASGAAPRTTWIVTKGDGSVPAGYAAGSVAGNVIGRAVVDSEWFRTLPSSRASVSTLIQGTVNGLPFLGNGSDNVKAGDVAEAMPRAVQTAIGIAMRDIKSKLPKP